MSLGMGINKKYLAIKANQERLICVGLKYRGFEGSYTGDRQGSRVDLSVGSWTELKRAYYSGVCLLDIWCQLPADGVAEVKRPIHTRPPHPDQHKQPFIRSCRTPPTQILNQTPTCLEWTGSLHMAS